LAKNHPGKKCSGEEFSASEEFFFRGKNLPAKNGPAKNYPAKNYPARNHPAKNFPREEIS
jgi:hypothetical protein